MSVLELDSAQSITLAIRDRALSDVVALGRQVDARKRLALYWADMRSRWHRGQQVTAEDYVAGEADADSEFIVDLLYSEYVLRDECDAMLDPETYRLRFPDQYAAFQRQVSIHEGLQEPSGSARKPNAGDEMASADSLPRIGKYIIVSKLGSGGQCDVYRAVHPELAGEVAIKLAKVNLGSREVLQQTLRHEGRLLSQLAHPHLARVYDLDVQQDRPYLVIEYVRGQNLHQYARSHRMTPDQIAGWVAEVARGLAEVHRVGLVHGDCKPNNIIIDQQGRARLIDFGMAWRCDAYVDPSQESDANISGTVPFMSPEQAAGGRDKVDHRSDIFGLGATLYYLITGHPPYHVDSLAQGLRLAQQGRWNRQALDAAAMPKSLKRICRRALDPDPALRFGSGDEMADALERSKAAYRRRRPVHGSATLLLGSAALVVVTAALGAMLMLGVSWYGGTGESGAEMSTGDASAVADAPVANAIPLGLTIRVWEDARLLPLAAGVPLRDRDLLQIRFDVPAGKHASLLLRNGDGRWTLLHQRPPQDAASTFRYPPSSADAVPLRGPGGTEFLLACVADEPIDLTFEAFSDSQNNLSADAWPPLGDRAVLRVQNTGVTVEQRARDLGPAQQLQAPEAVVTGQLEMLQQSLQARQITFDGIAFAHKP